MEYRTPYLAIIGILGLAIWSMDYWKVFQKAYIHLPINDSVDYKTRFKKISVFIAGLLAWSFISYSLMLPRLPLKFVPKNIEVNDIYFIIDVSRSMLADDLPPNRLEVAKNKIREFIKLRPTDRIGAIIFSEKVFTLLPLTTDLEVLDEVVSKVKIGQYGLGAGTNIGDALGLGVARATSTDTKNKIIVLLTDGVSNVGNMTPLQAAELAQKYKIKVYTIGIGTDESARIPIGKGIFGTRYQTIPGGSIDIKTLRKISDMTSGKSYVAKSAKSLESIFEEIQDLEKTEIKNNTQIIYDEKYYEYLLIGVLLFLFAEIIRKFLLKEML